MAEGVDGTGSVSDNENEVWEETSVISITIGFTLWKCLGHPTWKSL